MGVAACIQNNLDGIQKASAAVKQARLCIDSGGALLEQQLAEMPNIQIQNKIKLIHTICDFLFISLVFSKSSTTFENLMCIDIID
jgi:hypothetical protein